MPRLLHCLRWLLYSSAIVLLISGLVLICGSSYFIYKLYEFAPLTPRNVCGPPAILLGMGILTCCIGWYAWHFMDYKSGSQVTMFIILVALIIITEAGAGIWALIRHEQIDLYSAFSEQELGKSFALATTEDEYTWDKMQSRLRCCGVHTIDDYGKTIPRSCCDTTPLQDSSSAQASCRTNYVRGCLEPVLNHTTSLLLYIFLTALCAVLLKIFFAMCVSCYTKAIRSTAEQNRTKLLMAAMKNTMPQNAQSSPTDLQLLARKSQRL